MSLTELFKQIYFKTTGYSYPNLGRLFLRLFSGVMMLQFGIRQMISFSELQAVFPSVLGMTSSASLITMIVIEILTSVFIMAGFLTRVMILPPFVAMIFAEWHLLHDGVSYPCLTWEAPGYIPILFLGIYFFLLLVGPGKISVDYFLSLHLLHSENKNEDDLEVV